MKIEVFCSCGGGVRGRVKSSKEEDIKKIIQLFREVHNLPGCKPATSSEAARARASKVPARG